MHVTHGSGLVAHLVELRYVTYTYTSGFVDDVEFSRNGFTVHRVFVSGDKPIIAAEIPTKFYSTLKTIKYSIMSCIVGAKCAIDDCIVVVPSFVEYSFPFPA